MMDFIVEYWTYAATAVTVLCIAFLVCQGVRAGREAKRAPIPEVVEAIENVATEERARFKSGLQRIVDAPDPLSSFIDAVSQLQREKKKKDQRESGHGTRY